MDDQRNLAKSWILLHSGIHNQLLVCMVLLTHSTVDLRFERTIGSELSVSVFYGF